MVESAISLCLFPQMAAGEGGKLKDTAGRIYNGLEFHRDPERLIESTRKLLPSATVETDRLHPSHPGQQHDRRLPLREYKRSAPDPGGPSR